MVVYLDSGKLSDIASHINKCAGVTTNPSLLKSAGTTDYKTFAQEAIRLTAGKPISLEVLSDDLAEMEDQAYEISSWGTNIYVKVPVTTTKGESTAGLMRKLSLRNVRVNATALFTLDQIRVTARSLVYAPAILSVFAGRIADTGRDPIPFITEASRVKATDTKVLWASTREVYNLRQAEQASCDIITVSPQILVKRDWFGKDLAEYSLETIKQFYDDSRGVTL